MRVILEGTEIVSGRNPTMLRFKDLDNENNFIGTNAEGFCGKEWDFVHEYFDCCNGGKGGVSGLQLILGHLGSKR